MKFLLSVIAVVSLSVLTLSCEDLMKKKEKVEETKTSSLESLSEDATKLNQKAAEESKSEDLDDSRKPKEEAPSEK